MKKILARGPLTWEEDIRKRSLFKEKNKIKTCKSYFGGEKGRLLLLNASTQQGTLKDKSL